MAKTIVVAAVGGPEVMKVADVDVGHPGPGEIRLRQTAMGVNFGDIHKRRGTAPAHAMAEIQFPFTPGLEAVARPESCRWGPTPSTSLMMWSRRIGILKPAGPRVRSCWSRDC
jgi:NADPH2:quinone reductase